MEKDELEELAIKAALSSNWQQALALNKVIVGKYPQDADALNRIGYAFFKIGKLNEARGYFKKVLKIDCYNPVASKNLKRLKSIKKIEPQKEKEIVSPSLFLEEPGRTKIVTLLKIAPQETLSTLSIAQPVVLKPKGYSIEVRTHDKVYLGAIPDDLSYRLRRLIKNGYQYQGLVKNVKENFLSIFLREIKKGARLKGQPSFTPSEAKGYFPFLEKRIIEEEKSEEEESEKESEKNEEESD